jgi:hypothetical protein
MMTEGTGKEGFSGSFMSCAKEFVQEQCRERTMPIYQFKIRSHGSTIWVVEHYCRDDLDALEKAESEFGVRVWHNGQPVANAEKKPPHKLQ